MALGFNNNKQYFIKSLQEQEVSDDFDIQDIQVSRIKEFVQGPNLARISFEEGDMQLKLTYLTQTIQTLSFTRELYNNHKSQIDHTRGEQHYQELKPGTLYFQEMLGQEWEKLMYGKSVKSKQRICKTLEASNS